VEDGATLAEELEKCETLDDIPAALKNYEKLRKERAESIQAGSRKHGETWHYEDGPKQEERDRLMRLKSDQNPDAWSDKNFQKWLFGWNAFKSTY
jgi:salicylate hydroxylase